MVIVILIAIAALYYYIMGIIEVANLWLFVVGMLVSSIAFTIAAVSASKHRLTREQLAEIQKAEEKDAKNKAANEERGKQEARENAVRIIEQKQKILESLLKEAADLQAQLQAQKKKIKAMDVLGEDDANFETIDFLLQKMESHRANTITDALLLLDQEEKERRRDWERRMREDEERRDRLRRAQDELDAAIRQAAHNREMERQARRQAEALEDIRRNMDN